MTTTTSVTEQARTGVPVTATEDFPYKTIAIYPKFSDVGAALLLLRKHGFIDDQISLLGREQENWQKNLETEWTGIQTAKDTLGGAAIGSIPGLILVAGVALTGGAGILVAGPMLVAMTSLGLGALGGSMIGAAANKLDITNNTVDINQELADAIEQGKWVIVAHSYDQADAIRAQELLENSRIFLANVPPNNPSA